MRSNRPDARHRVLVFLGALLALRCVPQRPPAAADLHPAARPGADQAASAAFPDTAERRALYEDLLATVHKYHVFSAQTAANLGLDWEQSLRRLEPLFVDARDQSALREALDRFACSLHDAHLGYESGLPENRLSLGVKLQALWRDDHVEYQVKSVADPVLRERMLPGDLLVSVNQVPAEQLPRLYLDRSKSNNWPSVARDVGYFLTHRHSDVSATRLGDRDRWRLRRPRDAAPYQVELRWQRAEDTAAAAAQTRTDPDYQPARCHPYSSDFSSDRADRHYPSGYRISGYGTRFCLYTAAEPPYSYYPIIRHFSFLYYSAFPRDQADDARLNTEATYMVAADYFTLSRLLRERTQTRGLILDLRDNAGGNDPEWFLDWYAPAPYQDDYVSVRVLPEWLAPSFTAQVSNLDERWLAWYRQAAVTAAPGSWIRRPFKCLRPDCSGENRFVPARALLKVPVALLVGRGCNSSCAAFVNIFDEYDFGPLIGEPAQATQTAQVYAHPVRTRSGLELGRIKLALNDSISGKTGKSLEGVLPAIDYPVPLTFENRESWDAAHINAALQAFRTYSFPKHLTPLGP